MVFFFPLFSSFFGLVLNLCDWLFSISGTTLCQICTRRLSLLNPISKYIYRDSPSVPNNNSSTMHLYIYVIFFLNWGKLCGIQTHEIEQTLLPLSVLDSFFFVSSFAHNQIFVTFHFCCDIPPLIGAQSLSFIPLTHLGISLHKGRNWVKQ